MGVSFLSALGLARLRRLRVRPRRDLSTGVSGSARLPPNAILWTGSGQTKMSADVAIGTDEQHVSARLLEQACTVLTGTSHDVPHDFPARLFARAAPEDLRRYEPREIAYLAADTWSFLAARRAGVPKIRFESPPASAGTRLKGISVIEIVNDDMPFLVDSVMSQLNELGLDVRLVAHPIFAVDRDASGALAGLHHEGLLAAAPRR